MQAPSTNAAGRAGGTPTEPKGVRLLLIGLTLFFLSIFLVLPLSVVLIEALRQGIAAYLSAITEPDAISAIQLTLFAALVAVPCNLAFGIAAAWCIAKYRFAGRDFLTTLIDLPYVISPVVSGLLFVLLFGAQGVLGPWLASHDLQVVFAVPGILLVTTFVTFSYVARELLPAMEAGGNEEEEAAVMLGASGWQTLWRVTLPNVKWGLIYGVILCNARAMGEFGAVAVVSGHIRGLTDTLPLHVENLYNEYRPAAAFAAASLLTLLAVVTLIVRQLVEWQARRRAETDNLGARAPIRSRRRIDIGGAAATDRSTEMEAAS